MRNSEPNLKEMTAENYAVYRVEETRRELMKLSAKVELNTDTGRQLSEILCKAICEVEALADKEE